MLEYSTLTKKAQSIPSHSPLLPQRKTNQTNEPTKQTDKKNQHKTNNQNTVDVYVW